VGAWCFGLVSTSTRRPGIVLCRFDEICAPPPAHLAGNGLGLPYNLPAMPTGATVGEGVLAMADYPTRNTDSGVVVLRPEGRLNMVAAPDLREQLHSIIRSGKNRIVVDLSGVDTIDSSGLGALISGLKAARQSGGDLRIAAAGEQATAVLELTNLNRVLKSYVSAGEAFDDAD
jgi:anti-anti-sigma factor